MIGLGNFFTLNFFWVKTEGPKFFLVENNVVSIYFGQKISSRKNFDQKSFYLKKIFGQKIVKFLKIWPKEILTFQGIVGMWGGVGNWVPPPKNMHRNCISVCLLDLGMKKCTRQI